MGGGGWELYALIVAAGHDPAFWLAICGREHSFGTNRDSVLWRNDTRSWTNARSVRLPGLSYELITDAERGGPYVRYASVADSLRDGIYRLDEPSYVYQQEGRHSIGAVIARWTESEADAYVAYVVERMNVWAVSVSSPTPGVTALSGLIDIRQQLPHRPLSDHEIAGPFETRPMTEKRGLVAHYSGPPVTRRDDTLAVLQSEAEYHVGKTGRGPASRRCWATG